MAGKKSNGFAHEDRGNKKHEWFTPTWIFEMLGIRFDLDPCHPPFDKGPIPSDDWCEFAFTKEDDGLKLSWGLPGQSKIWMNPPYGNGIVHWMAKMAEHACGIALVFARTDVLWYREYALQSDAILYLKTRIKFLDGNEDHEEDKAKNGAGAGSMLIAWGDEEVAALRRMAHLGDFRDLRIERLTTQWSGGDLSTLQGVLQPCLKTQNLPGLQVSSTVKAASTSG